MNRLGSLARSVPTTRFAVRQYSARLSKEAYLAAKEEANTAAETWKKVSLFFAVPLCIGFGIKATNDELHHIEHLKHDPPKFAPYSYLRIRRREFPFGDGDHTLFHNPLTNPDPEE
ncbi:hypothetical protein H4219_001665 [Mycoemilia scoparia]|uniref:Cytochrome c oxidase polypeptide VIa n=1 Tax=Mycoemilia scoparia TaxID=417184 RepID=A0A9W8DVE6_9FUNG|nr:hypothetical protein H4219_001665 [Mycoemilia scoparia]